MRGLGKLLRNRADELNLTDAEVARRAGILPRRYGNYVNDDREPDLETLGRILDTLELEANQIFGRPSSTGGGEFIRISATPVAASAGGGAEVLGEEHRHDLYFRQDWLRRVTNASPENLRVIQADGDSMAPTINDGDHMLVDMTQTNPRRDGVYVIRWEGLINVKRVTADPARKRLTISSDNPQHARSQGVRPDDVHVLGRVIWIGRRI